MAKKEEWTVKKPDRAVIKKAQPKAAKPGLSTPPGLYRAGMHTELQKFGGKGQLSLLEEAGYSKEEIADILVVKGLESLALDESRALSAIQILLDETDYKGHVLVREYYSSEYKAIVPELQVMATYSDIQRALGIDGDTPGHHRQFQQALKGFEKLAEPKRITYHRQGRAGVPSATIVTERALITVDKWYRGLTEEEAGEVHEGKEKRASGLIFTIGYLLLDGIEDYYTLKPKTLHKQIQALYDKKRISRSLPLFIEWLLTLDKPIWKISYDSLAEKLRLERLLVERKGGGKQKKRLLVMLDECYEVARELGFLLEYHQDGTGHVVLKLNPEQCHRVRAKQLREAAEQQVARKKKPKALPAKP